MTIIYMPKDRELEVKGPKGLLSGRFKLEAHKLDGRSRVLAEFDNLILDAGLERMGTAKYLTHCSVGSGVTPPNVLNVALESLVGSTATIQSGVGGSQSSEPYFQWRRNTYRFNPGVATGNLSEVGVGWGSASLFSRALILDSNGNPTTISVLSDETLDVTYELRLYPPVVDDIYQITISGSTYDVTSRARGVTSWDGANGLGGEVRAVSSDSSAYCMVFSGPIGTITGFNSGSNSTRSSVWANSYSSNSLTATGGASWSLDKGNFAGGIVSAYNRTDGMGAWQHQFDPPIPKDNTKTLTLNFSVSWGRYAA